MEVFFNGASLVDVRNAVQRLEEGKTQNESAMRPTLTLAQPLIDIATDMVRFLSPDSKWNLTQFEGTLMGASRTKAGRIAAEFMFTSDDTLPESFAEAFSFSYRRRGEVEVDGQIASLHPEKLGDIYPLKQALEALSSPFYLSTTEAIIRPAVDRTLGVAVKTTLVDLAEYNRLQVNSGRRIARALERSFPSHKNS